VADFGFPISIHGDKRNLHHIRRAFVTAMSGLLDNQPRRVEGGKFQGGVITKIRSF
jgi:hypothetical protein